MTELSMGRAHALWDEQVRLEARMATLGTDKFRDSYERWTRAGRATDVKSTMVPMNAAIGTLVKAIDAFRVEAETGKAGRRHSAVRLLKDMESPVLAYLTVKVVMDRLIRSQELTPLAIRLAGYLEVEKNTMVLKEQTKGAGRLIEKMSKDFQKNNLDPARIKNLMGYGLKREIENVDELWQKWSLQEKTVVGLKLIELLCQATGLFEIKPSRRGKKTISILVPTALFQNWLESLKGQFELLMPEYLPCIIPPKDWNSLTCGGYHTDVFAYDLNFVKTRSKEHKRQLKAADLSPVYSAVNALQRTSWAINARVLDVAFYLMDIGSGVAGLPVRVLEKPAKPHDIDSNEEARTAWSREAGRIWRHNIETKMQRLQAWKTIKIAMEFRKYDKIYFPYQLDFRGRIYTVPSFLSPQSTDLAKGLLHFGEGDAITNKKPRDWLAIHGANCFGVDKVSFEERLKWIQDNEQRIIDTAYEPLDDFWWAEADSPFCFLAFCFEWLGLNEAEARGETFVSRLPIAMDGSCNGLQHYSAMLRDPVAGKAVNLVPSDEPQDIYGTVADLVNEKLCQATKEPDLEHPEYQGWAAKWLEFGIDRKITKRPVMVLPYGGTFHAVMEYVQDAVHERGNAPFEQKELRKACNYLAGLVWASIGEVVVSAKLAMDWLRKVAGSRKGFVSWITPVGFPVVQHYTEHDVFKVNTTLFGKRYQPKIAIDKENIPHKNHQVNGVAPNFVHSLDASALMMTVNEATKQGLTQFSMIHDSYGTTAAKSERLAKILRGEFVKLYEDNDPLSQFEGQDLPPFVGGLNLSQLPDSAYFFA